MRIDLHTHSSTSDGTDSPAEVVRGARAAALDVVALTDHDTFDGLAEAVATGREVGVQVVPGLEMSTKHQGRSVHLLAYGMDVDDHPLRAELDRILDGRDGRLPKVLALLEGLGMPLSEDEVRVQAGTAPALGRPHIADAMIARGYVADRKEAFDRFLHDGGPAHVERYACELVDAIPLVRAAGGVAVIAHPWGRGSAEVLTPDVLTGLVRDHGLAGFEVDHNDHGRPGDHRRAELRELAESLDCLGTGSSDYHGLGKKDHPLGCNLTSPETFARLRTLMEAARRM
ncbi:PHP domain-containing protein [Mariniluteicoccus endophyticus]